MIEAIQSEEIQANKFKDYFATIMLNDKNEATMKSRFTSIYNIFSENVVGLLRNFKTAYE
jgi:hypothetical protein